MNIKHYPAILVLLLCSFTSWSQLLVTSKGNSHIMTSSGIDTMMQNPSCLEGWEPAQKGLLKRTGTDGSVPSDSTFTIQKIRFNSDSVMITGWLYLPLAKGKHPLVILTNTGGNGQRPVKNVAEWLAPILSHCGIAAFVHDKRGTGESGGIFRNTTYADYAADAGNSAIYLSDHPEIDSSAIGVIGASEGGTVALLTALRYPQIKFVVTYSAFVTTAAESRIYAQRRWLESMRLPDSLFEDYYQMHLKSIKAWESGLSQEHVRVDAEIKEMRNKRDWRYLPFTSREMDSIPELQTVLPTWNSLSINFLPELAGFNKSWLALYGANDNVVPVKESMRNIEYYMTLSENNSYKVALLPETGHMPINLRTKNLERIDNMIINWLNNEVFPELNK